MGPHKGALPAFNAAQVPPHDPCTQSLASNPVSPCKSAAVYQSRASLQATRTANHGLLSSSSAS